MKTKIMKWLLVLCVPLLLVGMLLPDAGVIPVAGATPKDWNPRSFWYTPWGLSGVHKEIDIFAKSGTPVLSSSKGLVLYSGSYGMGGTVLWVLGPKWRLHYYAHLSATSVSAFTPVQPGMPIGRVGNSGNAAGKPSHLHYAIRSLIPLPWQFTRQAQGWDRMFFIDPNTRLLGGRSPTSIHEETAPCSSHTYPQVTCAATPSSQAAEIHHPIRARTSHSDCSAASRLIWI